MSSGGNGVGPALVRLAQASDPKKKAPAGQKQNEAAPALAPAALTVPPPEVLLLMVRTNIIAVDQANKTNNYSVLRALAGPGLQALAPEQIAERFADLRAKQIDLAPTIVVSPQLTQAPQMSAEGLLQLTGFFPTRPLQVHFQMVMQPVQGFWRLAGLTINVLPPAAGEASTQSTPEAGAKKDGKSDKK